MGLEWGGGESSRALSSSVGQVDGDLPDSDRVHRTRTFRGAVQIRGEPGPPHLPGRLPSPAGRFRRVLTGGRSLTAFGRSSADGESIVTGLLYVELALHARDPPFRPWQNLFGRAGDPAFPTTSSPCWRPSGPKGGEPALERCCLADSSSVCATRFLRPSGHWWRSTVRWWLSRRQRMVELCELPELKDALAWRFPRPTLRTDRHDGGSAGRWCQHLRRRRGFRLQGRWLGDPEWRGGRGDGSPSRPSGQTLDRLPGGSGAPDGLASATRWKGPTWPAPQGAADAPSGPWRSPLGAGIPACFSGGGSPMGN